MLSPEKPTPTAEDLHAVETLAWDIVDRLIARYHEARSRAERARELAELDRRLDRWADFESAEAVRAETGLVRAILATAPGFTGRPLRPEKHPALARGVIYGRAVYLAYPDPYREGESSGPDSPDAMRLLVFYRAALVDATAGLPPAAYSLRAGG